MVRNKRHVIGQDWDEADPHVRGIKMRKHARFEASLHVTYEAGGRRAVSFSQNISQGGMLLRQAPGLSAGNEVDFVVTLNDGEMPMEVRGEVLAVSPQGVRVCFAPNQAAATERLSHYVRSQVVPALEAEMTRPISSLHHVVQLANLYADQGRYEDAVALYRAQLHKRARQIVFFEHMCRLIGNRSLMRGQASGAEINELEQLARTGLALGPSAVLEQTLETVERLRAMTVRKAAERLTAEPTTQTVVAPSTPAAVCDAAATNAAGAFAMADAAMSAMRSRTYSAAPEAAGSLNQREARLVARQEELRVWEASLDAREATLKARTDAAQTADVELNGRTAALERVYAAHAQRLEALDGREAALTREQLLVQTRRTEVAEQTAHMAASQAALEAREHAVEALRAQLEAREQALAEREGALTKGTAQVRKEQAELIGRQAEVERQLGVWQASYEANVRAWVQRVRQFSVSLRVKLTAKQEDAAAANKAVKLAQAALTEREMLLAAEQRELASHKTDLVAREAAMLQAQSAESSAQVRLAQLNQLLKESESDVFQRDQAIAVLKQTLKETRAALEAKTKLVASLSHDDIPDSKPPVRVENAGFEESSTPTGREMRIPARRWQGDVDVIDAQEVVEEAEPVTGNMIVDSTRKMRVR